MAKVILVVIDTVWFQCNILCSHTQSVMAQVHDMDGFYLKPPKLSLNSTAWQNASPMLIFCIIHCTKFRLNPMTVVTEYHNTTYWSQRHLVSLKSSLREPGKSYFMGGNFISYVLFA